MTFAVYVVKYAEWSVAEEMIDYPKPSVTVDSIIFALSEKEIHVLLIQRKGEPFKNRWALPGGFLEIDEPLENAAYRELEEETGLRNVRLAQFRSYGAPGRDPRGRTITVAYITFLPNIPDGVSGADDAADARWFPVKELPELAFDHDEVLRDALSDLHARLFVAIRAADFFSEEITLARLRDAFSYIIKE